jgi:DNA repair ATPase RecN
MDSLMPDPEDELANVRVRLHRLNDTVQKHEGTLIEHGIKVKMLEQQVNNLTANMATSEQLENAMTVLANRMTAAADLLTLQIKTITDNLDPIRKAVYWVVGLVMTGVILAGLAFLFRRPLP